MRREEPEDDAQVVDGVVEVVQLSTCGPPRETLYENPTSRASMNKRLANGVNEPAFGSAVVFPGGTRIGATPSMRGPLLVGNPGPPLPKTMSGLLPLSPSAG